MSCAKSIAVCACVAALMSSAAVQVAAQTRESQAASGPTPSASHQDPGVAVLHSQVRDIELKTGEQCRTSIILPDKPPPVQGYPIFYYVDTGENAAAAFYSDILKRARKSVAILVGVACARATEPARQSLPSALAQGLSDEVVPIVEHRVSVKVDTQRRSLYGRGEGGRLVLQAIYSRPDTFQTYILASPQLDEPDHVLAEVEKRFSASRPDAHRVPQLAIIVASDEPHIERARRLHERLKAMGEGRLRVSFKEFSTLDFFTVAPAALSYAFDIAI